MHFYLVTFSLSVKTILYAQYTYMHSRRITLLFTFVPRNWMVLRWLAIVFDGQRCPVCACKRITLHLPTRTTYDKHMHCCCCTRSTRQSENTFVVKNYKFRRFTHTNYCNSFTLHTIPFERVFLPATFTYCCLICGG